MRNPIALSALIGLALLSLCPSAFARIGDTRSGLEKRLCGSQGGGVEVSNDEIEEFHLDGTKLERVIGWKNEKNLRPVLYFKTANGDRAYSSKLVNDKGKPEKNPDGWVVLVIYYQGKSVLEYYRRPGGMSDAERNGLLMANRGSTNWQKGQLPNDLYPNEDYKPLLPQNFYRADGNVLANQQGDALLFFDINFDEALSKTKRDREAEEAPNSLSGF